MRDKRPVDELSIEELERILAIRKREERQNRLKRMRQNGRLLEPQAVEAPPAASFDRPATVPPAPASSPARTSDALPRFEDDPADLGFARSRPDRRFWRSFADQVLLLVEIAAVLGLIYLGYLMLTSISRLERETASAAELANQQRLASMPTLAPTPQLQLYQVVLPGGHTPPTAPGGARFNYEEIPANLLPLVQNQINQPIINRPPPTVETALQLSIPRLNIDQTIVQGTDWEALKLGIGQLINGVNPGDDSGNLVLAAHNDIYGEYFRHLDQLEPGDEFYIRTQTRIFTYRVTGWELVKPTDVHVMDNRGGATATLISCYPYQVNTQRIVVYAERVDDRA